jgi:hypothetical protein
VGCDHHPSNYTPSPPHPPPLSSPPADPHTCTPLPSYTHARTHRHCCDSSAWVLVCCLVEEQHLVAANTCGPEIDTPLQMQQDSSEGDEGDGTKHMTYCREMLGHCKMQEQCTGHCRVCWPSRCAHPHDWQYLLPVPSPPYVSLSPPPPCIRREASVSTATDLLCPCVQSPCAGVATPPPPSMCTIPYLLRQPAGPVPPSVPIQSAHPSCRPHDIMRRLPSLPPPPPFITTPSPLSPTASAT